MQAGRVDVYAIPEVERFPCGRSVGEFHRSKESFGLSRVGFISLSKQMGRTVCTSSADVYLSVKSDIVDRIGGQNIKMQEVFDSRGRPILMSGRIKSRSVRNESGTFYTASAAGIAQISKTERTLNGLKFAQLDASRRSNWRRLPRPS